eukprot:m.219125 g.219125  ORF g.219125 m.219125 type:complete len:1720 (+) comp15609_c0_seq4:59-5218(+)
MGVCSSVLSVQTADKDGNKPQYDKEESLLAVDLEETKTTIEAAITMGQDFSPDVTDIIANAGLDGILSEVSGASAEVVAGVASTVKAAVCSAMPWLVSAAEVVGPAVPFFAPVFSLLTKAYGAVCAMKEVNEQVQAMRTSLEGLASALFRALQSYKQATDPALLAALEKKIGELKVKELLGTVNTFLSKQTKKGFVKKFLLATDDAAELVRLDKELDKAKIEVGLHLAIDSVERLAKAEATLTRVEVDLEQIKLELRSGKNVGANLTLIVRREHARILAANDAVKTQLEVYVPLRFGCKRPPVEPADQRELDALMQALLGTDRTALAGLVAAGGSGAQGPRGVVVQGAAGTGKSLFGWRMMQYWDNLSADQQAALAIPVIISLPAAADDIDAALENPDLAARFLFQQLIKSYSVPELADMCEGFTADQLLGVYNERFVFVLDGADELGDKVALHKLLHMAAWPNSVFVVTARTGFYTDDQEAIDHASGPALRGFVRGIHLLPFGDDQTQTYIDTFAAKSTALHGWEPAQYRTALAQFPQLSDFLREPLLLYLTLSVLPGLAAAAASGGAGKSSMRMSRFYLQVTGKTKDDDVFPSLKRAELYSLFVHQWAEREAVRGNKVDGNGRADPKFIKKVHDVCLAIAAGMFLNNKTQYVRGEPGSEQGAGEDDDDFDIDAAEKRATASTADHFLDELLAKSEDEFRSSPIKRSGSTFSFLHKTVQEYFVALQVCRELGAKRIKAEAFAVTLAGCDLSGLLVGKRLLTAGNVYETLRFCADMVDGRGQWYVSGVTPPSIVASAMKEGKDVKEAGEQFASKWLQPTVKAMWDIVQASRQAAARSQPSMAVAAANCMMVLNAAGMVFSGCDLSNATLGPVASSSSDAGTWSSFPSDRPGEGSSSSAKYCPRDILTTQATGIFMDVSGGVFDNANLSNALLTSARLDACTFVHANVRGANLSKVDVGQLPMLLGHAATVESVCVTADGKCVVSASHDKTVRIWSLETGDCLCTLEDHEFPVSSVCVTEDGKYVVSGSYDSKLRVWSLRSGELVHTLTGHTRAVSSVCVTADGKRVVSGSKDKTVRLWSLETGEFERIITEHSDWVNSVCVTVDGEHVVSGLADMTVCVSSLKSGECLMVLPGHTAAVTSVCATQDGKRIISGSQDRTVRVWSLPSGSLEHTFRDHLGFVMSVCTTADSKYVISGSQDQTVRMWSLDSKECLNVFSGHTGVVNDVFATPSGKHLVSASKDQTMRVWSLKTNKRVRALNATHTRGVTCEFLSADGKLVVSGSADETVRVWSIDTGECVRALTGHTSAVLSVCLTPDNRRVVSASNDQTVRVSRLASGQCETVLREHTAPVTSVCVTADGTRVVSGSRDTTVRIWSLENGKCLHTLSEHSDFVTSVCVTADNEYVVSGSLDRTVKVWSLETGSCLHTLTGNKYGVQCVSVSANGQRVFSGSMDGVILVWAPDSDDKYGSPRAYGAHPKEVSSLSATADGSLLVSTSLDGDVYLWSVDSEECLHTFKGHTAGVTSVSVDTTGKFIVTASLDKTVRVWSVPNKKPTQNRARTRATVDKVQPPSVTSSDSAESEDSPQTPFVKPAAGASQAVRVFGNPLLSFAGCECQTAVLDGPCRRLAGQLGAVGLESPIQQCFNNQIKKRMAAAASKEDASEDSAQQGPSTPSVTVLERPLAPAAAVPTVIVTEPRESSKRVPLGTAAGSKTTRRILESAV